ncbi:SAVED domain-containing protein [Flavobacterium sp. UGB4466]|uniref:SAVED domain-containing protein n=1 Tax=Flavobacterium sp. UGB4466 TaxID=2730889 RepID=UPI00192B9A1D|nr:SAVED domain-containing protein [Flavobacterium sp. UGB4466]
MADSVLAIQKGFEFQAKFFWYKACSLYRPGSTAVEVTYEADGVPGFDDVTVSFDPPRLSTYGYSISRECYQVKFHVDHSRAFDVDALIDPSFIGAVSESLLQKLYKNYLASPEDYAKTNYYIINTWGVDQKDDLIKLLNNEGAVIFKRLFDGTTDRSQMGKIRKKWRDHLGLSEDRELKIVLRQLRIRANHVSGEYFDEPLSFALAAINLKPLHDDKRTSPYSSLIVRLHEEKSNRLHKDNLYAILAQEDLWVTTTTNEKIFASAGLRTFRKGAENMEMETDKCLCLLKHFESRYILDGPLWQSEVLPSIEAFSQELIGLGKPIVLHLDAHISTAYALGYYIGNKSGTDITIVQKSPKGRVYWKPELEATREETEQWDYTERDGNADGDDLVLSISISNDISAEVDHFVESHVPNAAAVLHAKAISGCGFSAVRNADHIMEYIVFLNRKIRTWKTAKGRGKRIHIFISAPNSFNFFLGQQASGYGRISLYEYDFEGIRSGTYVQSLNLP